MARKQHSVEFQDQACRLFAGPGYTRQRAADELGVTRVTIQNWLKDYAASDDPRLLKGRTRARAERRHLRQPARARGAPTRWRWR